MMKGSSRSSIVVVVLVVVLGVGPGATGGRVAAHLSLK
jgi:hypothetical protein